jgi:hypothetical protein
MYRGLVFLQRRLRAYIYHGSLDAWGVDVPYPSLTMPTVVNLGLGLCELEWQGLSGSDWRHVSVAAVVEV